MLTSRAEGSGLGSQATPSPETIDGGSLQTAFHLRSLDIGTKLPDHLPSNLPSTLDKV